MPGRVEQDEFVGLVYDRHMPTLLQPLALPPPAPPTDAKGRPAATAEWVRLREAWSEACGQVRERERRGARHAAG